MIDQSIIYSGGGIVDMSKRIVCDVCGKVLDKDTNMYHTISYCISYANGTYNLSNAELQALSKFQNSLCDSYYDLCPECTENFEKWLKERMELSK